MFSSCENYNTTLNKNNQINSINKIELINSTIQIKSKSDLKNIIKSYKNSVEGQNNFNNEIKTL